MRLVALRAAVLLAPVLFAGCSLATPASPSTASPAASPSDEAGVGCPDEDYREAQEAIAGQQRAFADGDFALARGYSSAAFQSRVSTEEFEAIVTGSYGFLLGDPKLTYLGCAGAGQVMELGVEVEGDPNVVLRYRLTRAGDDPWLIDVAGIVGTREEVTA